MVLHKSLSGMLATAALAAAWMVAAPAGAAFAADTTTTFTVSGGALGISAPTSAGLGTGAAAGTLTAQLGAVTATDTRGALGAGWTAAAASTVFASSVTGAASITTATYSSGLATGTTGTAVFLQGQTTTPAALSSTAVTAYSASASVGNNSATWNPTIVVSIPAQAIAGTYTGTITHSLS